METLWQDVIFGLRTLRKNPSFTFVSVIALALGIGANATVFTLANAFLFKNLPFADSDRVLYISSINRSTGHGRGESYPDYGYFQSQAKSFQTLGAFVRSDVDLSDSSGLPTQYKGAHLTYNAFSLIGQKPVVGRDFLPEDARFDAPPAAIISYNLWENRYGKAPSIVGRTIRVNEVPTVVVGVMPPGIRFPSESSLWMPLVPSGEWEKREYRALTMFGRLSPDADLESAKAEMKMLASRLENQYPATNKDIGAEVETFNDYFTDSDTQLIVLALLGAVGFVLLIACANVANLSLAKAVGRAHEISIRCALGAGRWRVIRQLLVESVMLSTAGGVLGSMIGTWGVRIFERTLIPEDRPAYLTFDMDLRVVAYLAAITIGTGILFGLAPALRLSKLDVNSTLKDGGHGSSRGLRGRRLSAVLAVTEVALAFVLLTGAGLMIRSFLNMAHTPIGVRTDHLMSMDILLRPSRYPKESNQIAFHQQLKRRLEALPGVKMVAMASHLPGDGWTDCYYQLEGAPTADPGRQPRAGLVIVSPEYFPVMEIPPSGGRVFSGVDGAGGIPVVVVNESFAKISWPGQDPVGKRLRRVRRTTGASTDSQSAAQPWLTVVGLIHNIVQSDQSQGARDPLLYLPYGQNPSREMVIVARTLVPPANLGKVFRREVQALDGDLPVTDLRTLDTLLWERTWGWRVYGSMFSIFALIALLLAAVGLYAVIAQGVNQRTQEIGVRIAMGASRSNILGMVFAQGVRQLLTGLVIGLAASFGVTEILGSLLVGVKPADPATLGLAAMVLTVAGVLGCAIPARRATQIDPIGALRYE